MFVASNAGYHRAKVVCEKGAADPCSRNASDPISDTPYMRASAGLKRGSAASAPITRMNTLFDTSAMKHRRLRSSCRAKRRTSPSEADATFSTAGARSPARVKRPAA